MPFFRRKTDKGQKQVSSPQRTTDSPIGHSSRVSSQSSIGSDVPNGDLSGQQPDRSPFPWGERPRSLLLSVDSMGGLDKDKGDLGQSENCPRLQTPVVTSSRLSKTLHEVIHDKEALPYFIQYMSSRGAEHVIKFWLDAESFQASSWTRIRSHSLQSLSKSSVSKSPPSKSPGTPEKEAQIDLSRTNCDTATTMTNGSPSGAADSSECDMCDGKPCGYESPHASPYGKDVHSSMVSANTIPSSFSGGEKSSSGPSDQGLTKNGAKDSDIINTDSSDLGAGPSLLHRDNIKSGQTGENSQQSPPNANPVGEATAQMSQRLLSDVSNTASTPQSAANHSSAISSKPSTSNDTKLQDKLKKSIEKDAVNIYSKYIAQDATHGIGITDHLRNEAISRICKEDGQVDPQCFMSCQKFVVDLMERDYFPDFLQSDFHCKHQIDVLTGTEVCLADILYNDSAMFYFMEFMEQEGVIDLLQCWLAMDNLQQQLSERHGQYDGMEAQSDAMVIYDKYFSLQATNPLGFSDKVRFEVECNICREEGPLPDCFATAKRQVLRTIDKVHFPQFAKSELYFKYLNDLINTVHTAQDIPVRRKRAGSDASSEHSLGSQSTGSETISTKNTLLAGVDGNHGNTANMKKALNKFADDMRIDNVLFNPDALWKRQQAGKMSLGRINAVGQFVSELDPEPEGGKKIKSPFFKKKRDKEKTQEEMALQIAQMIISDVTLTTQCATGGADDVGDSS